MRLARSLLCGCLLALALAAPAGAHGLRLSKQAVATGSGGAVASDTVPATQAGLRVLAGGGTAADAAVAVASTLGVTDPFVAGIGGGGYFVYYDARTHRVYTIDGRETAPAADTSSLFVDSSTGKPLPFPTAVTSGLSVGVPGTLMTWQRALDQWGRFRLANDLRPAERGGLERLPVRCHARRGGPRERLPVQPVQLHQRDVPPGRPTAGGRLDHAQPGSRPDLRADRSRRDRRPLRRTDRPRRRQDRARPPARAGGDAHRAARRDDPRRPRAYRRPVPATPPTSTTAATTSIGMAPSSSGGTTVGEALNILSNFDLGAREPGAGAAPLPGGRRDWRTPTATATSAIRPTSKCR